MQFTEKIPLDAFDLTDEEYQAYEQWNWDAAVERNNWLEENGHSYVDGLSKDKIEWEKIRGDEIGMRNIDLIISALAILVFSGFLYRFSNPMIVQQNMLMKLAIGFLVLFSISAFISYSRGWLTWLYYPLGFFGVLALYWLSKQSISGRKYCY